MQSGAVSQFEFFGFAISSAASGGACRFWQAAAINTSDRFLSQRHLMLYKPFQPGADPHGTHRAMIASEQAM
jgi:hypothetical protein